MFCDRCGAKARAGALFCASCGADLRPGAGESASPARQESVRPGSPALGVALLDATGLGLGHFLMRRWVAGVALAFGTLVALGVAHGAPNAVVPFLLVGWLVLSGLIGYRAARLVDETPGYPLFTAGFGIAALVLIVGGCIVYVHASDTAYAAALADHRQGECVKAIDSYDRVEGVFALKLPPLQRPRALPTRVPRPGRDRSTQRGGIVQAGGRGILQPRVPIRRADGRQRRAQPPAGAGAESVGRRHARAGEGRRKSKPAREGRHALRPRARRRARVRRAREGLASVRRLASSSVVCTRAEFSYALGQPHYASRPGIALRAGVRKKTPALFLECGRALIARGQPGGAVKVLQRALALYPRSPVAAATRASWIKAEVAAAHKEGGGSLPAPTPAGSAPSGTAKLVVANDSKYRLQVFLDGPKPSVFEVPACSGCSDYRESPTSYSCDSKRPSRTITLKPGRYAVEVKASEGDDVTPFTGSWSLSDGVEWRHCLFVVSRPLFDLDPEDFAR